VSVLLPSGLAGAAHTVERVYPGSLCVWYGSSYYDDLVFGYGRVEVASTDNGAWLYCPAVRWANTDGSSFDAYMWLVDDSTSANSCWAYHHSSSSSSYYYDAVSTTTNSSTPSYYEFDRFDGEAEQNWYFYFYCWINKKDAGDARGSGVVSYYLKDFD